MSVLRQTLSDTISWVIERIDADSTLKNRVDAMTDQRDMFEDRIVHLDDLLSRKETRLYQQFYAMEQALASLQMQQSALNSLSSMISQTKATT